MNKIDKKPPWKLRAGDFSKSKVHAPQDWRFQMFFEYLRISPSYNLASECKNEAEFIKALGDKEKARKVWKTYQDIGNVYGIFYRDWWLKNGLRLFGTQTAKPITKTVLRLSHAKDNKSNIQNLIQYLETDYAKQGEPDSLLVSIPLSQKRVKIMKQLKLLLDEAYKEPIYEPKTIYQLTKNKMQYRRLLGGLRLAYFQCYKPKDALWRVALRAKISHSHGKLDPDSKTKDRTLNSSKKVLTFMASRLMTDTLLIAENAAQGNFPSVDETTVKTFDTVYLGQKIKKNNAWEKTQKANFSALNIGVSLE